jgi:hypothetical protein
MGRLVPRKNGGAERSQPLCDVRGCQIGPGDGVTQIEQNFRNAAHSDAPDPDKMDFPNFPLHRIDSS